MCAPNGYKYMSFLSKYEVREDEQQHIATKEDKYPCAEPKGKELFRVLHFLFMLNLYKPAYCQNDQGYTFYGQYIGRVALNAIKENNIDRP